MAESAASLILEKIHPEGESYEEEEAEAKELGPNGVALVTSMEEFMEAIRSNKPVEAAQCLKSFFELCEEEPHEEGPHVGE